MTEKVCETKKRLEMLQNELEDKPTRANAELVTMTHENQLHDYLKVPHSTHFSSQTPVEQSHRLLIPKTLQISWKLHI